MARVQRLCSLVVSVLWLGVAQTTTTPVCPTPSMMVAGGVATTCIQNASKTSPGSLVAQCPCLVPYMAALQPCPSSYAEALAAYGPTLALCPTWTSTPTPSLQCPGPREMAAGAAYTACAQNAASKSPGDPVAQCPCVVPYVVAMQACPSLYPEVVDTYAPILKLCPTWTTTAPPAAAPAKAASDAKQQATWAVGVLAVALAGFMFI